MAGAPATKADVRRLHARLAAIEGQIGELLAVVSAPAAGPQVVRRLYSIWSEERDARLKEMHAAGKSMAEVAGALDCGPTSIHRRAAQLGIRFQNMRTHNWTDSELAALREGHAQGQNGAEIAASLGISDHIVRRKAKALGLSFAGRVKRSAWTPAHDAVLREAHDNRRPLQSVMDRLPCSYGWALKQAERLGLRFNHGPRWTAEEDAALRRAVNAGHVIDRIAGDLGRNRASVVRRIGDRGLAEQAQANASRARARNMGQLRARQKEEKEARQAAVPKAPARKKLRPRVENARREAALAAQDIKPLGAVEKAVLRHYMTHTQTDDKSVGEALGKAASQIQAARQRLSRKGYMAFKQGTSRIFRLPDGSPVKKLTEDEEAAQVAAHIKKHGVIRGRTAPAYGSIDSTELPGLV